MTGRFLKDMAGKEFWNSGVQSDSFREFLFLVNTRSFKAPFILFQWHDGMACSIGDA
jgi:hypothetical protein